MFGRVDAIWLKDTNTGRYDLRFSPAYKKVYNPGEWKEPVDLYTKNKELYEYENRFRWFTEINMNILELINKNGLRLALKNKN